MSSSDRKATTDSSKRLTRGRGLAQLHADRVVLGLREASTEAEHEATTGQPVDRRRGAGQQRWVMELVVDHERADAESRGCLGCHHQGNERIDRADVVVGVQLLVAEVLDLSCRGDEPVVIIETANLYRESERPHVSPTARVLRRVFGRVIGRTVSPAPQTLVAAGGPGASLWPRPSGVVQW